MMNVAKMVAAALKTIRAAARQMIRAAVWVGGQLVSMLIPAPPALEELEPAGPAEDAASQGKESEFMAIRNLASARYQGRMPSPELLAEAGRLPVEWVSSMSKPMLKSLLCGTDSQLRGHMRGAKSIPGLLAFDEEAIDSYRIAMLRERAREEQAKLNMTPLKYA